MRWTEAQRAMLQAMGLRVWSPAGMTDAEPGAGKDATAPAACTVPGDLSDAPAPASPAGRLPVPALESSVSAGATAAASTPAATPAAEPGQADALRHLDWSALRAAVVACTACGLCKARTQTVFGVGHEHAQWMIVGEAPGEQEDLRGEPFVGAAGRLLDRMLLSLQLTRAPADPAHQVYIANTLKCRPPHNRNPQPEELAHCLPFLERQVQLVQPRVILAMGRFAVQALLGTSEPVGRLRGKVHAWRGHPLVVTYHPAYLLRQPAEKARAWADLCLAADVIERKLAG